MDQGAAAVKPGVLVDEGGGGGPAAAYGVRGGAVPEPVGVLEPGDGYFYDCGGTLHAGLRVLRGEYGEAVCAGGG